MKIIAKTKIGQEFFYNPMTARKVSDRSADYIWSVVNEYKYLLDTGRNESWHVYEIDKYCQAYDFAMLQSFTIRNGIVTARNY